MKIFYKTIIVIILYALLAIPDSKNPLVVQKSDDTPVVASKWWGKYAQNLVKFRITNSQNQIYQYTKHKEQLYKHFNILELQLSEPNSPILDSIQFHVNKLSALTSLIPSKINEFEADVLKWRQLIKYQCRFWDISSLDANNRLYQLVTESRLAFESALIQTNHKSASWSSSPFDKGLQTLQIENINLESGDIIAFNLANENYSQHYLINNLPNAYKHLGSVYIHDAEALLTYIDYKKGLLSIPLDKFVKELAPNGIVLRLRGDTPAITINPELPFLAASVIKNMAKTGKYQYDYNYNLDSKNYLYDWELLNNVYKEFDLDINPKKQVSNTHDSNMSHIEAFELEYDYNFSVVGEWHNSDFLYNERIIAAATVTIAQLKNTNNYNNPFLLPIYRILKIYSYIANHFISDVPIPTGISAQTQLILNALQIKQTKAIIDLKRELKLYEKNQKHKATYLKMLQAAKELKID